MQATINRINNEERGARRDIERLLVLWCVFMHDSLTWPRNGVYKCRTCGRHYPVPWAHEEPVRAPASGIRVLADSRA